MYHVLFNLLLIWCLSLYSIYLDVYENGGFLQMEQFEKITENG